jgi:hypothetical protein
MQLFWWIGLCKMTFDQTFKGSFNDFFHDTVLNSPNISLSLSLSFSLSLSISLSLRVSKSHLICITSRTVTNVSTHAWQRGNIFVVSTSMPLTEPTITHPSTTTEEEGEDKPSTTTEEGEDKVRTWGVGRVREQATRMRKMMV